jgi:hypothetical protein
MAGFRTYNNSNWPLWLTIYTEPGGPKMDWGDVAPRAWRQWGSMPYARLAYYRVRGEWPMHGATDDVSVTTRLDGPFPFKPFTFIVWNQVAWWTRPCWRTINRLDRPIWIAIYNASSDEPMDWGELGPKQHKDWFSGDYGPNVPYRLRAQSVPTGRDFDVEVTSDFEAGWGEATFLQDPDGSHLWRVERNPSGDGSLRPPKEPDANVVTNSFV